MCVVSMIGDHYGERFPQQYPGVIQTTGTNIYQYISREEFEQLKRDVLEMKELLKKAKIYDEEHGEPDCQKDEKIALLRKIAELVGVDLEDVFDG